MGLLSALKVDDSGEKVSRWARILDEDASVGEPEFSVEVLYADSEDLEKISRSFRPKKRGEEVNLADLVGFRKAFMRKFVVNWENLTKGNLKRLSGWALRNSERLKDLPDEIPYCEEDAAWLGSVMDIVCFYDIMNASLSLADFAREQLAREKKGVSSSSDSA